MATEFRTAFLGFNRDDVLKYVHKKDFDMKSAQEKASTEIAQLKASLEKVTAELESATKQNESLLKDNATMKVRLDEFEAQAESINHTAEKIGKLYLVSKTSAKTILDKAHESSVAISNETSKNLENILLTQDALSEIKARLVSSADEFIKELEGLNSSLDSAKDTLNKNTDEQVKVSAEFAEIYQKLG